MDGSAKGKNRGHGGKPIKTYNDLYKLDPGESIGAGYSLGIYTRVPGGLEIHRWFRGLFRPV